MLSGEGFDVRALSFGTAATFAMHRHRRAHVVIVSDGEWVDVTPSQRTRLKRGDVLLDLSPIEHETSAVVPNTRVIVAAIRPAVIREFRPLYGNRTRSVLTSCDDLDRIPDRIEAELRRADDASGLIVRSLLVQLLALGSRGSAEGGTRTPEWVARVIVYVNANLSERLTTRGIAAIAQLSESHLSRTFARYFGHGVTEYVRECRLRAAARALRISGESIKQIAFDAGFSDHAHLCRVFKAAHGITPSEYRHAHTRRG